MVSEQYIPYPQAVNPTGFFEQHIVWERTKKEKMT